MRVLLRKDLAACCFADIYGRTPLHYAAEKGNEDITYLLLKNEPNVDRMDSRGRTALACAAANAHERVV